MNTFRELIEKTSYILVNTDTQYEVKLSKSQVNYLKSNEYTHNKNNQFKVPQKVFDKVLLESQESLQTDLHMEIFKMLKKKFKDNFTHTSADFKEEETIKFEHKGDKFKVYMNTKDFNKPVYDYEYI